MAAPDFDLQAAHRYFAAECFNRAWDLMEQAQRTPEEDETMLRLSLASTWHWSQRADCTPANLSVGCWQTARIYTLLGQADNARRYAQLSLAAAETGALEPFYFGYAYEALARASALWGDAAQAGEYLRRARQYADQVADAEDRALLLADLERLAV